MTQFQGFPSGNKVLYTSIPNAFFSALLPQITDINELQVTLHIIHALYNRKGYPRFISYDELLGNPALMVGLNNSQENLRSALKKAVERGALLTLNVEQEGISEGVYFLNEDSSRQAVEKIKSGEIKLAGFKVGVPPATPEPLPDIFTAYEQNIGMLTPMIADELRDVEKLYPSVWIHDAIKEAVLHNKRNIRYITKILENWSVEGRSDGTYQRDTQTPGPDKYFKGKYGHMVRR